MMPGVGRVDARDAHRGFAIARRFVDGPLFWR